MKILLTGAAGQLGRALQSGLASRGELLALTRRELDLSDSQALREALADIAPDLIVNAAAYTAVDQAESDPRTAQAINATAPAILAEAARKRGALLVHYSTDYVFDGRKTAPYVESDATSPLSAYGRSKRDGEEAILASGARHLILRTEWLYSLHGKNFLTTMLRLGALHKELRVVGDQVGAPTWVKHVAEATVALLDRCEIPDGLYHLAAAGEASWFDYAEEILREAVQRHMLDSVPTMHRITTAEYPLPAPRPANSRLDCSRIRRACGITLPDWQAGLRACLDDRQP